MCFLSLLLLLLLGRGGIGRVLLRFLSRLLLLLRLFLRERLAPLLEVDLDPLLRCLEEELSFFSLTSASAASGTAAGTVICCKNPNLSTTFWPKTAAGGAAEAAGCEVAAATLFDDGAADGSSSP